LAADDANADVPVADDVDPTVAETQVTD